MSKIIKIPKPEIEWKFDLPSLKGEALVLCLDASLSMADPVEGMKTKIDILKESSLDLLFKTDLSKTRVAIVEFRTDVKLLIEFCRNVNALKNAIDLMKPEGNTSFWNALEVSLQLLESQIEKIKRIIVVSDGHPTDSGPIAPYENRNVIIDTVSVGGDSDEELLRSLSGDTGGVFVQARDVRKLSEKMLLLESRTRGLLKGGSK